MRARIVKDAKNELDTAIEYHHKISQVLGDRFERDAYQAIVNVVENPTACSRISGEYRRCRFSNFKYGIVYRIDEPEDEVVILAFMHLSREPDYWVRRD